MNAVFYTSSIVAVIATVAAVTGINAVHSLLYLIVSLLAVALVFFTLGAPIIAALEVIIYAGAIIVLF
ncbi:MAG: NADH-quinone oxidoreductase subunit J, partial [Acidobacteria bacterium]|nr:NADH-quinone oxidoreductase subunit J [Acidobacteriota bacterium]